LEPLEPQSLLLSLEVWELSEVGRAVFTAPLTISRMISKSFGLRASE